MENIERTQFVVLTGHLDDQPLPDLIRTLRVQRKTGRLQVEYPDAPGAFFFEEGQLVDAQLGTLHGLEAVYAAVALRGAAFNFNPLVRPPERSIDRQQQKFISDLIEVPRRESLPEIGVAGVRATGPVAVPLPPRAEPLQLGPVAAELIAPLEVRLVAVEAAITSASRRFSRERLIYTAIISFLVALILGTLVQVLYSPKLNGPQAHVADATLQSLKPDAATTATNGEAAGAIPSTPPVKNDQESSGASERGRGATSQASVAAKRAGPAATQARLSRPSPAAPKGEAKDDVKTGGAAAAAGGGYVVHVLMEVKNGRVTEARVLNPRPGASDYESLALRMARQRRYPDTFTGAERLQLRVKP